MDPELSWSEEQICMRIVINILMCVCLYSFLDGVCVCVRGETFKFPAIQLSRSGVSNFLCVNNNNNSGSEVVVHAYIQIISFQDTIKLQKILKKKNSAVDKKKRQMAY